MLKSIRNAFFPQVPTAAQQAAAELQAAERSLLQAQSDKEYAESMVRYHQARINRLRPRVEAANDGAALDNALRFPTRRAA